MRVGIIAPTWLPIPAPAYGGTETVIDTLARGLQKAGHSVLLVGHPDSTVPVDDRRSVVPREDTLRMGRAATELEHAIGAYALVQECDVVHDHTLAGPPLSIRYPDLPVVATNHMPFTRTMSAIFGAAVPHVGLIAISRSHAASTDLPTTVVHHGVDVGDFPVGKGDGGYVASLARMAPEKGLHRAIAIAKASGVQLRIAAKMREPREVAYFEEFVEPHLGPDVVYVGELGFAEKVELLAGAAALLNPIEWPEPFGMAMVEAMACGTPVIGCPRGAAPEIVVDGETGFLSDDDDALAQAIRDIGRIDRDACRARVCDWFSMERMVEGHLEVYEVQQRRLSSR